MPRRCRAACEAIRCGEGPQFLEITTFRSREHVGIGDDLDQGYRSRAEFDRWQARDPLVQNGALVEALLPEIDAEIEAAFAEADVSPAPSVEYLLTDIV